MKKRKKKRTQAVRILDQQHHRKQQRRWWIRISTFLLLSFILFFCWLKLHDSKLFPIQVVTIEGDYQHIDEKALKQAILPFTHNSFFMINMVGLRERLLQFSWLESVFISREWPNRLRIQLKEQQPVATWDDNTFLNAKGDLFVAEKDKATRNLPALSGPQGEQNNAWQTYTALNTLLLPLHLSIVRLQLTEQQAWSLVLNNGLRLVLGQQDLQERLQRFIKAYPSLAQNKVAIEYIDLRYNHGLAVKYKKQPEKTA